MTRLLAVALLAAAPARANETMPFVFPQSDTAVVYVTGDPPVRQTLHVSAALGLQRVDAPGGGMAMITDNVHRTVTVLDMRAHAYSVGPAPSGTADMRGRRANADYARLGGAVVAGLPCTEWATHDPAGHAVIVCLTADGVLTRARAGDGILVQAVSVEHANQDSGLFAPPADWRRVAR